MEYDNNRSSSLFSTYSVLSTVTHISIFWLCHRQYETLVTQSGIEPSPPALEAWSLNHWTAREVMRGTFCGSNQTSSDDKSCGQSIFLPEYASHPLPHALVLPILESQPQGLI